jgi:hypothetical protein
MLTRSDVEEEHRQQHEREAEERWVLDLEVVIIRAAKYVVQEEEPETSTCRR